MNTARKVDEAVWPDTLAELMEAQGWSKKALAREMGVEPVTVRRWLGSAQPSEVARARLIPFCESRCPPLAALLALGEVHDLAQAREAKAHRSPRKGGGGGGPTKPTDPPIPPEEPVMITTREYLTPDELDHFGLDVDPFEDEMPDDLYMPKGLAGIEAAVIRGIRGRKIIAMVGPPGSGKSALVRRLWAISEREKRVKLIAPALMDRRKVTLTTLSVAILRDLIQRDTSNMHAEGRAQLLRQTLQAELDAGQYPVVFIDEAHDLRDDALIAVKRLWDSHVLFRQLAVILVGQAPLAGRLRSDPTLAELAGRTQVLEVPAWGEDAVGAYLAWRLARIGCADASRIFTAPAVKAIASRADRPLWINNVAVLAMRQARLVGDQTVVPTHVGRA